jgi:2-isopropylmalate synthase
LKLHIYDTTLREGEQSAGLSFSPDDRLKIIHSLDALGVSYTEVGVYSPDSTELALFGDAAPVLENTTLVAFTPAAHPGISPAEDRLLSAVGKSSAKAVTFVGKASERAAKEILKASPDENLLAIRDTARYFKSLGKEVFFDAEHFFDGYSENPSYALSCLEAAQIGGADFLVLCDTNGGMLPDVVGLATAAAISRFKDSGAKIGIHTHNDIGMADACAVSAALSGASMVQGTISGIGERCGNADILTLIPLFQLKLGFSCLPPDKLSGLTAFARASAELMNRKFNERAPFVGGFAFKHKAGQHIDAMQKSPGSFEHISPEAVGNRTDSIISALSGRAALYERAVEIIPGITKDSPILASALEKLKKLSALGYDFEGAEASLALLLLEAAKLRKKLFKLDTLKIISTINEQGETQNLAKIKVLADGKELTGEAYGNGPVNALDLAFRNALGSFYPEISKMRLADYKVRVVSAGATASVVRVVIESTDGKSTWRTVGASPDIINASRQALEEAFEYYLREL